MKILTPILLAATLALPTVSFAGDDHPKHKHSLVKKLDRIVDLTDTQKAQIADLHEADAPRKGHKPMHKKLMREISQLDPTSTSYQAELDAIANEVAERARERVYHMAERSQEIKALLTEEQLEKLNAFHAEKREKQRDF